MFLVFYAVHAQASNTVFLNQFQPYESQRSPEIEERIQTLIRQKLEAKGFIITNNRNQSSFTIEGFYLRNKNGNLNIFAQIYDPATNTLIDSVKRLQMQLIKKVWESNWTPMK